MKIENPMQTPSLIRTSRLQTPKEMYEANNTGIRKKETSVLDNDNVRIEKKGVKIDKYS